MRREGIWGKSVIICKRLGHQPGDREMNVTDFNLELPPELIAQDPLEDRSASRLLV